MSKTTYTTNSTVAALLADENIDATGITQKTITKGLRALREAKGHMTISELTSVSNAELWEIPTVGIKTLKAMGTVMHYFGLPRHFD